MRHDICADYLKSYRKAVGAKKNERIDKRYIGTFGYLAPDDHYYSGCCGHDAEVKYLEKTYGEVEDC